MWSSLCLIGSQLPWACEDLQELMLILVVEGRHSALDPPADRRRPLSDHRSCYHPRSGHTPVLKLAKKLIIAYPTINTTFYFRRFGF